jgi:hypothetical protein
MLYSCGSLGSVWYLFADYTERAFLLPPQLFKHPLRYYSDALLSHPGIRGRSLKLRQTTNLIFKLRW